METFAKQIKELQATHIEERVPKVGDRIPAFELEDVATGALINSEQLLAKGGIVITFYRGQWCPYCNTALKAVAQAQPAIAAKGARTASRRILLAKKIYPSLKATHWWRSLLRPRRKPSRCGRRVN